VIAIVVIERAIVVIERALVVIERAIVVIDRAIVVIERAIVPIERAIVVIERRCAQRLTLETSAESSGPEGDRQRSEVDPLSWTGWLDHAAIA
jgi:hypothetical protein